jgi:hypothetical protein
MKPPSVPPSAPPSSQRRGPYGTEILRAARALVRCPHGGDAVEYSYVVTVDGGPRRKPTTIQGRMCLACHATTSQRQPGFVAAPLVRQLEAQLGELADDAMLLRPTLPPAPAFDDATFAAQISELRAASAHGAVRDLRGSIVLVQRCAEQLAQMCNACDRQPLGTALLSLSESIGGMLDFAAQSVPT